MIEPWPRDSKGILLKVPTPELTETQHHALSELARTTKSAPKVLCQHCGNALRAWSWDLNGPHTCHVCTVTGRLPR